MFRAKRVILIFLLLAILAGAFALARWGTQWTIPASDAKAQYQLSGYWDAALAPSGKLQRPIGIAVAPGGDVYVTDARNRIIRLSSSGEFRNEWGREGSGPGEFSNPVGIAVAPDGSVFVSDYNQDHIQKFTPEGHFLHSFGASGNGPGQFNAPSALAVDPSGFLYVADFYNHRVQQFLGNGSFQKLIGHPGRIGPGALHYPTGLSFTRQGNLMVADAYNYQLQWFDAQGAAIRRVGYHLFWLWPLRVSSNQGFKVPTGVAAGRDGLIHVADSGNHRIVMLSEAGSYLTEWKLPDADPNIYSPEHIATSNDGTTVYATDLQTDRILVLEVRS